MIGTAVFYTVDSAIEARDEFAPRLHGVTVEEAAAMDREQLVMWTPTNERFSAGQRTPTPYTRFFYRGEEIINPWALFRPLPPKPVREDCRDDGGRRSGVAGRQDDPVVLDDRM